MNAHRVLLSLVLLAGCSDGVVSSNKVARTAQAYTTAADLITPSTCTLRGTRLIGCTIPEQSLSGLDLETAVPVRTVLKVKRTGTCTTHYPLEVSFQTPGEDAVKLSYLSADKAIVRRRDRGPIPTITLRDPSPYTKMAAFDASCKITLDIVSNEPDVDSKADAMAIIDRLTKDLADKTLLRDRLSDLVHYHTAYEFLDSVVARFYGELTSDAMQKLRADAKAAKPTLMKLVTDEACGGTLSDEEFANVISLYEGLTVLGAPEDWHNDAGATKTLAEAIGPDAEKVLATARKLSAAHGGDAGVGTGGNYGDEYKAAALAVEVAKSKLDLAKVQLAIWLAP